MKGIRRWHLWVIGAVVTAAVIGTAAGVMAQTPVPGVTGTSPTFLERVAQKLGIDVGTLRDAVKSSANDVIDEKVQSGDLTQAQADQLKERVANAPDNAFGWPGFGPRGFGKHGGWMRGFDGAALAQFLGISTDQLQTELRADGATLASVAQAHGKSRDELKAFLTDQAKAALDQAVKNGALTQAQADSKLADLTANLDQIIDGTMPCGGGHFRGPFWGGPPQAPATPSSGGSLTPPGGA